MLGTIVSVTMKIQIEREDGMRFELIFQLKNNTFPIDYRRVILSYIKKALQDMADGKYYDN